MLYNSIFRKRIYVDHISKLPSKRLLHLYEVYKDQTSTSIVFSNYSKGDILFSDVYTKMLDKEITKRNL